MSLDGTGTRLTRVLRHTLRGSSEAITPVVDDWTDVTLLSSSSGVVVGSTAGEATAGRGFPVSTAPINMTLAPGSQLYAYGAAGTDISVAIQPLPASNRRNQRLESILIRLANMLERNTGLLDHVLSKTK